MSLKKAQEIKGLRSMLAKIEGELDAANESVRVAQRRESDLRKQVGNVRQKIQLLESSKKLNMSEHALLRYIERSQGLDILAISAELLEKIRTPFEALGDGTYPIQDTGLKAVVKNATVVTIR